MRNLLLNMAVIGLGVTAALPAQSAHACTGSTCAPDRFLPFEGSVPASAYGIQWWRGRREGVVQGETLHVTQPNDLTFRCGVNASAMHDVAFHIEGNDDVALIVPDASLVEGEQCAIEVTLQPCPLGSEPGGGLAPHQRERADFMVTAAIDPPTILGTLVDDAATVHQTTLSSLSSSCRTEVAACGVAVELQLHPSVAPWADSLIFTTYVDGEPWWIQGHANAANPIGGSFVGRGNDLVFLETVDTEGAGLTASGPHTIQIRANLVGTDTDLALETALIHVNIDCDDTQGVARDAGVDASVVEADAGVDASVVEVDSGVYDASVEPTAKPKSNGGCSVMRATTTTTFASWLMLVVIGAFSVRRIRPHQAQRLKRHA